MTDIELLLSGDKMRLCNNGITGHSDETKKLISLRTREAYTRGGIITDELRAHRSARMRQQRADGTVVAWNKGLKQTPELIARKCKPVITPLGKFDSIKAAAVAHGLAREFGGAYIRKRIKKGVPGYEYI
jgi:hypothetical protein